jgi:excisionase family DNA binding protein
MMNNYNNKPAAFYPMSDCFRTVQESFGINDTVGYRKEKDARATRVLPRMRTVHEAAQELRRMDAGTAVTEYHIRQLAINNRIPRVKAGKKYLINLDALIEYLSNPSGGDPA